MLEVKTNVLSSLAQDKNSLKYFNKNKCFFTQWKRTALTLYIFSILPPICGNWPVKHVTANASKNPAIILYEYEIPWYEPPPIIPKLIACNSGLIVVKCDLYLLASLAPKDVAAYIFYGPAIKTFPLPRSPKTIWGLVMDESPISNTILLYEKALNLFNLSSTFSRHSDTPIPLHMLRKLKNIRSKQYFVNTLTKNALLHDNAPVVFFNRDCHTLTEREAYVRELKKYIQIDSYGDCLHNKDFPFELDEKNDDMYGRKLLRYLARYKFIIAIENAVCIDYVTEKFWRAIEIGVVPIYYGSPSIRDWLPNNKSAILLEDFPTPKLLSQHLHYLLQNDTAYEEYLEHKTLGLISNQNIVNEIKARPYQIRVEREEEFLCLVCRRIHDTNDTQVNIVTKDHYNCQTPGPTALSLSANPSSMWDEIRKRAELKVDSIYKEMEQSYSHLRKSNTNWDTQEIFPFYLKLANVPMS